MNIPEPIDHHKMRDILGRSFVDVGRHFQHFLIDFIENKNTFVLNKGVKIYDSYTSRRHIVSFKNDTIILQE